MRVDYKKINNCVGVYLWGHVRSAVCFLSQKKLYIISSFDYKSYENEINMCDVNKILKG